MSINKEYFNSRIFSLFVLVFEGFGIRIFQGVLDHAILIWTALLLVVNFNHLKKVPFNIWLKFLAFCLFYYIFTTIKGVETQEFLYAGWLSALCVLSNYIDAKNNFIEDLFRFTKLCVIYSLLHVFIYVLFRPLLIKTNFGMNPLTFAYLFYFNDGEGFLGFPRIQGFCWEPSCWNTLLNLNLALCLILKKLRKEILVSILAIIFVFSTTGLAVMFIILIAYAALYSNKRNRKNLLIGFVLVALIYPIVSNNLKDKLSTGSGATRYGDFYVAAYVMETSPWLGGDLDNITDDPKVMLIKAQNWGGDINNLDQYHDVGMTNAFAGLFVEWGIPITLLIFFFMVSSPLYQDWKMATLISITLLCVLMGTPIARTGFFYLFPLSGFLLQKKKNRKKTLTYENNFNYYRNL